MLNRREFLLAAMGVAAISSGDVPLLNAQSIKGGNMAYTAKDYSKLIGMEGFSETLLKNHFTLY